MFFLSSRSIRRRRRSLFSLVVLSFFLFLLDTTLIFSTHVLPKRTDKLSPGLVGKKIYIASIHRNSEYVLRWYWNAALLEACKFLGPENVFVSIVESGSQDSTKGALIDLKGMLDAMGVQNKIVLGETVDEQIWAIEHPPAGKKKGWVESGRGNSGWEKRRISALAETRNKAMEPLVNDKSRKWDRVLWVNDVIFTNEDIATLLSTKDGNYAAACSLDFQHNAQTYYDTFALRDSSGNPTISTSYPFFSSRSSLNALYALDPIPVQSCWNGLVAFDATPFYPPITFPSLTIPQENRKIALSFRAIPDSLAQKHLEASECCLINTDNPLSVEKGVYMNPNVRVTYNASTYPLVNPGTEWPERLRVHETAMENFEQREKGREGDARRSGGWPGRQGMFWGRWGVRGRRWTEGFFLGMGRSVWKRVRIWERERREEGGKEVGLGRGGICLVDEMQVLHKNGWLHIA